MIEMDQNFNKVFWDACANGDFPMVCSQIKAGAAFTSFPFTSFKSIFFSG